MNVATVATWIGAAVALGALLSGWWTPGPVATAIGATVPLAALVALVYAGLRLRDPLAAVPRKGDRPARLLLAPTLAVVAASGGLRSPALAVLALVVLWCLRRRPLWAVAVGAATTLAVVTLLALVIQGPPAMADVAAAIAVAAAAGVGPKWIGRVLGDRLVQERRRSERLGGLFAERALTPAHLLTLQRSGIVAQPVPVGVRSSGLSPLPSPSGASTRASADALPRYLRDVRDWAGADEVVFWRRDAVRGALVAGAWSTADAPAPRFVSSEWVPMVSWAAEQRLAHIDREGAAPRLAVAPVEWGVTPLGALTIVRAEGLRVSDEELRLWLPRFAVHVAALSEMFDDLDAAQRQTRHAQALLGASREFPTSGTIPDLAKALFRTARTVTSARHAALVRWFPDEGRGAVVCVSDDHPLPVGIAVSERSYAGAICAGGRPYVWDDARLLDGGARIYGDGEPHRVVGSLGIIPLHRKGQVLGALVLEGEAPQDVRKDDQRTLRNLADFAAASLAALLEIEVSKVRATTDELTGLANRRGFDEAIAQRLSEVDRVGGTVALVLADVDHFKRVNDAHGHEVGDAVLRSVAATLREKVRDMDFCARYGGEEIVMLLPHTDLAGAVETAERLRRAVEARPVSTSGVTVPVTLSFGVASYPATAASRESFFSAADKALYRAKAEGRNCVRSAQPRDIQPRL
ncbi:MAG TPA: sensor domain-containing diguanylate cyclase [Gemmatimonadaceae bacterium]|nr:sensor domain-containing diguanylate cyclase [Gemmatimonadaceae bacterium]